MMRRGRKRNARGFTLLEILLSLVILVIGLMGILALQTTTVKSNRLSRELTRANGYAGQIMEDLRTKKASTLAASGSYPDIVTSDGVTYQLSYTVSPVAASPTLVLVTAVASFVDDSDGATHSSTLQLLRTTEEAQ